MASQKLLDALNKAIAMDLRATIQFMWQHVMALGMDAPGVKDVLKDIAMEEMKHSEAFAERLYYLGGTPTTTPMPISVGGTLKEMLETDLKIEAETIKQCKTIIQLAIEDGDPATRLMGEKILAESEGHEDKLQTVLGRR